MDNENEMERKNSRGGLLPLRPRLMRPRTPEGVTTGVQNGWDGNTHTHSWVRLTPQNEPKKCHRQKVREVTDRPKFAAHPG